MPGEKDLFLGADVSVRRGTRRDREGNEIAVIETIAGSRMVKDTDLKPEEVKELKKQGVIRPPNDADRAVMEAAERQREAAEREEKPEGLSADELNGKTKEELEEYMTANGIATPEKGTGADGAVVKADLVKAIRKAQR